ncbi:uncharacterized protein LOC142336482 [Convolutriloba macropyga]|uniref:uncharacterized protein LOC142336482 n=1 Tax=Convolutriloba macropyga TaxID=536237 RepID=UPI003F521CF3
MEQSNNWTTFCSPRLLRRRFLKRETIQHKKSFELNNNRPVETKRREFEQSSKSMDDATLTHRAERLKEQKSNIVKCSSEEPIETTSPQMKMRMTTQFEKPLLFKMRRKLFNNYSSFGGVNSGGKMSPNQRTKSGSSSQGGNESQDSIDWGPMESALSSGISNDEQFANANWVEQNDTSKQNRHNKGLGHARSSSANDSDVFALPNEQGFSARHDLDDEDDEDTFDEKRPLAVRKEEKDQSKLLRKAVKKQIEVARNEASELKRLQKQKAKTPIANFRLLIFAAGNEKDFSEAEAQFIADQLNFKLAINDSVFDSMGAESICKKKIRKIKKILANFFAADIFNRSSEADKIDSKTGVPIHCSDPKLNPDTKENDVPEAVKALMNFGGVKALMNFGGGTSDKMNHDIDCTVSDLRFKFMTSEMNNETKQFTHMKYPYLMLWVHDQTSLHVECGPMLAALKSISNANNENKIGVLRRLVYGEPIGDDHVIVDEETLKELKRRQQRKKELNHMATPQELEGSQRVDDMLRMPEVVVMGSHCEMIMYCKTCMELQRVIKERKLKLTFVKNRDDFFKYLFTRPFLTDNVCQGALVACNLILCGLYEKVDGMNGFSDHIATAGGGLNYPNGSVDNPAQFDRHVIDTEYLSD